MDGQDSPPWFHGRISRGQAEKLLASAEEGVFLIRNASQGDGYVLSSVQSSTITHFQIRTEAARGRKYFTFDTETSQGPLFRTLAGVVHYLINTPNLLPVPLTNWIQCETSVRQESNKSDLYQSLTDALCDSLAEQGADYAEPVEYVAKNPAVLFNTPQFLVRRSSHAFYNSGDVIRIVSTEVAKGGVQMIVCENQNHERLTVPFSTKDVQLVPFECIESKSKLTAAPPLPRRTTVKDKPGGGLARGYEQFIPLNHRSMDEPDIGHDHIVYRELIMEGYLQKLPPMKNTFQGWKRRWFRLVVVITNTDLADDGPVMLEYYDKPGTTNPKGVINLTRAQKISPVDPEDERVKVLSKVNSSLLFKIVLENRTYPLKAESPELVTEWLKVLNETIGLTESGAKAFVAPPESKSGEFEYRFQVRMLKGTNAADGYPATILLQERKIIVQGEKSGIAPISWYYSELQQYGYVKQILWLRCAADSEYAGMTCFSTPDAEAIWTVIRDRLKSLSDVEGDEEFAGFETGGNAIMKWGNRNDSREKSTRRPSKAHLNTRVIFGKTVGASELTSSGIAVVKAKYTASSASEMDLNIGEIIPILACQQFKSQGFLLSEIADNRYQLVKESNVQLHEHAFSALKDDDDLLDGVDPSLMDAAAGEYEVPVPLAVQAQSRNSSRPQSTSGSDSQNTYEYGTPELLKLPTQKAATAQSHDYVNAQMDYINAETIQKQELEIMKGEEQSGADGFNDSEKPDYVNAEVVGMRRLQQHNGAMSVDYVNAEIVHGERTRKLNKKKSSSS